MVICGYMLFLGVLGVAGLIVAWLRFRRWRVQTVVQALALIVGQNVPLVPAVRSAGRWEGTKLRRIFDRLARHLNAGKSISEALQRAYPACPGYISGALEGAEQGGTLPSVLRSLAADLQHNQKTTRRYSPALLYFSVLGFVIGMILLMFVVVLLPKFQVIFLDFGLASHPLYEQIQNAVYFGNEFWPIIFTVLGLLGLALCQEIVLRVWWPRPRRMTVLGAVHDGMAWYLPGLRQIAEMRALARQLPVLQAGVRAGHDLVPAARQAACVAVNIHAQRRMRRWADRIEAGGDPAALTRSLGFPPAFRRALSGTHGPEELSGSLEYLCSYYRSLLMHWEQLLASASIPAVVLLWAGCVAYVALMIFMPLYAMLDSVMAENF